MFVKPTVKGAPDGASNQAPTRRIHGNAEAWTDWEQTSVFHVFRVSVYPPSGRLKRAGSLGEVRQKCGQYSLGHAPDHPMRRHKGVAELGPPAGFDRHSLASRWVEQHLELEPFGGFDFGI